MVGRDVSVARFLSALACRSVLERGLRWTSGLAQDKHQECSWHSATTEAELPAMPMKPKFAPLTSRAKQQPWPFSLSVAPK
jgi:hypothetical protein